MRKAEKSRWFGGCISAPGACGVRYCLFVGSPGRTCMLRRVEYTNDSRQEQNVYLGPLTLLPPRKTKRKREETSGVGVDVRAPAFPRTPLADGQVKRKSRLEEPLGG
jgi:hypothetical protein